MALSLITKAWPIVMQPGRKFVLVALCDAANDDGECFLCVETIAYKCGMGLRTVQGHLIDLEADSFIWREERLGRSSIYSVNVVVLEDAEKNPLWVKRQLMKRTPAKSAGVKTPQTPAVPAPPPADSAEAPAVPAPIPVSQPSPLLKNNNKARSCVLPDDFTPNETALALAVEKGVNVVDELAAFTDHHSANGSTFIDWQAAFRTWTRKAAIFAKRDQRSASAFSGSRYPDKNAIPPVSTIWHESAAGVAGKAVELGISAQRDTESHPAFKRRVLAVMDIQAPGINELAAMAARRNA